MPQKTKKKKGIAYLHQDVLGRLDYLLAVLTVFTHECITAQFSRDLWHDSWFADTLRFFTKETYVYKCLFLIILTGSGAGSLVSVSVINKVFFILIYRLKTNSLCISVHLCVNISLSYSKLKMSMRSGFRNFYLLLDMFHSSLPIIATCTTNSFSVSGTLMNKLLTTVWTESAAFSTNQPNLMRFHRWNDEKHRDSKPDRISVSSGLRFSPSVECCAGFQVPGSVKTRLWSTLWWYLVFRVFVNDRSLSTGLV